MGEDGLGRQIEGLLLVRESKGRFRRPFFVVMTDKSSSHFFGRRKGKPLRARQALLVDSLLPRVRITPAEARAAGSHASPYRDTWLEIGFGGGEHLVCDAILHPDVRFIGCEPFVNGVAKLVTAIADKRIANVLIYDGDALEMLKQLPAESLGRITILYPDPWPKFRQRKRRIVSLESITEMARALRSGGEVHFATDIDDYSGWTLQRFLVSGDFEWTAKESADWKRPWFDWPGTRYEAKAIREGRTPAYLTFVRKQRDPV